MKESVLDVLLYLFENVMHDAPEASDDRDSLRDTLLEAGFSSSGIRKAFDWLDDLARERPQSELPPSASGPLRLYADAECERLDVDCRGFLLFLETNGILNAGQRELVVERVMALDHDAIELDDLKLIVLMVLFNQPGSEDACAWLEADMFAGGDEAVN